MIGASTARKTHRAAPTIRAGLLGGAIHVREEPRPVEQSGLRDIDKATPLVKEGEEVTKEITKRRLGYRTKRPEVQRKLQ